MKKNKIILLVALALALIATFFILKDKNSTIKQELKDFAVKDTAKVDKIFLADRSNNKILLEKQNDGTWSLNKIYQPTPYGIKLLLETIASLRVQSPVAKAAYDNVLKQLAGSATKVEIYQGGTLVKTYYVGGPTQEQTGTFMLLENSSTPFVMEIPGFMGYLSPRYYARLNDWRDKSLFKYHPESIKMITVEHSKHPQESFKIVKSNNFFSIVNMDGSSVQNFDTSKVRYFVSSFKSKNIESFDAPANKDSILNVGPFCTITVINQQGKNKTVKLYMKPTSGPENENKASHDLERMYATIDREDFAVVQYYMLNPILLFKSDFLNSKNN